MYMKIWLWRKFVYIFFSCLKFTTGIIFFFVLVRGRGGDGGCKNRFVLAWIYSNYYNKCHHTQKKNLLEPILIFRILIDVMKWALERRAKLVGGIDKAFSSTSKMLYHLNSKT